jgi:hypothetical protein
VPFDQSPLEDLRSSLVRFASPRPSFVYRGPDNVEKVRDAFSEWPPNTTHVVVPSDSDPTRDRLQLGSSSFSGHIVMIGDACQMSEAGLYALYQVWIAPFRLVGMTDNPPLFFPSYRRSGRHATVFPTFTCGNALLSPSEVGAYFRESMARMTVSIEGFDRFRERTTTAVRQRLDESMAAYGTLDAADPMDVAALAQLPSVDLEQFLEFARAAPYAEPLESLTEPQDHLGRERRDEVDSVRRE